MLRIKLISFLLHISELYLFYPRLRKFYKKAIQKSDPLIIDVGSNKGQTIDFFLSIFPNCEMYGFEPNPTLFDFLQHKYRENKRIHLFNFGVSNISGTLMFHENKLNETSSFEELNYDSEYLKVKSRVLGVTPKNIIEKSYVVNVVTLRDFFQQHGIKNIDVIKIDVEGHEYNVLSGLFEGGKTDAKHIQLEQHFDDIYAHSRSFTEISNYLQKNQFSVSEKIKHSFGNFEEIVFVNNNAKQ